MAYITCEVCGTYIDHNYNTTKIIGRYNSMALLCEWHHAVVSALIARHGTVNWRALGRATSQVQEEKPNVLTEPERWLEYDSVARLKELYEEEIVRDPTDWPPYESPHAKRAEEEEASDRYLYR